MPEHVCIRIALTKEIGSQYVAALKRYFNVETITGIFSNYYGYYYIKIPLQLIAEHKDKIYEKIAELMQEPRAAFAYRCHTNQTDFYRDFKFKLDQILSEFGLDKFKCDIVGMVLLNMFQSKAKLTKSHFDRGAHNFGYLLETYFYLNISKNEAKQLVESITSEFPPIDNNAFGPLARLVSSDAFVTVGNENRGPFRKIIIDTRLLTSELFLHKFKETLKRCRAFFAR